MTVASDLRTLTGDKLAPADGALTLVAWFKEDCPTCDIVLPLVDRLATALPTLAAVAVSQSDRARTSDFVVRHGLRLAVVVDEDLDASDAADLDAVPTLDVIDEAGVRVHRVVGLHKPRFEALVADLAARLGVSVPTITDAATPDYQPGCGSRTHDPDVATRLDARRRGGLASRRLALGPDEDAIEFCFDHGFSDGLPVVPPTPQRVAAMLAGTTRQSHEIVTRVPPNYAPVTVEKVAVNAVLAGCRPEYLPVVLTAVEAACSDTFNMHGVLATTYPAGPVLVVNGPLAAKIGMHGGLNALGQGNRANLTIGRALQLVVRNVGGGRPGGVDRATLGQPGKISFCFAENEAENPWAPLHVERGFCAEQSTVTVFAGEAPRVIVDQVSTSADALAGSLAMGLAAIAHPKWHLYGEAMLILVPEHVRTLVRGGYTKARLRERIQEVTSRPLAELLPDADSAETIAGFTRTFGAVPSPEALATPVAKFRAAENLLLVVAGSNAGKFSAIVGGWVSGPLGSVAVTKEIEP